MGSVECTKQVSWAPVHAGAYIGQACLTSLYISVPQTLLGVHMRSRMHSLFIRIGGRGLGGSTSLCRKLVAWRGGFFLIEGKILVLSCVFYIFGAGASVRGCMCVYMHTHTHTALGVLDVRPGVGTRHLVGRRIQMDKISANMHKYLYTKYTIVHICRDAV